eukprot:1206417-Prymnesium_polylepis.1
MRWRGAAKTGPWSFGSRVARTISTCAPRIRATRPRSSPRARRRRRPSSGGWGSGSNCPGLGQARLSVCNWLSRGGDKKTKRVENRSHRTAGDQKLKF